MLGRLIRECWREELGGGGLRVEMRVTQMAGWGGQGEASGAQAFWQRYECSERVNQGKTWEESF